MVTPLPVEKPRRICDPAGLDCTTTHEMEALDAIIGQARAVTALRFGLGIKESGFNIYVAGAPGTGRTTAIKRFLEEVAADQPPPDGWCYAESFHDPYRPKALRLPPGRAQELQAFAGAEGKGTGKPGTANE